MKIDFFPLNYWVHGHLGQKTISALSLNLLTVNFTEMCLKNTAPLCLLVLNLGSCRTVVVSVSVSKYWEQKGKFCGPGILDVYPVSR